MRQANSFQARRDWSQPAGLLRRAFQRRQFGHAEILRSIQLLGRGRRKSGNGMAGGRGGAPAGWLRRQVRRLLCRYGLVEGNEDGAVAVMKRLRRRMAV
jgi:hypothetical protein